MDARVTHALVLVQEVYVCICACVCECVCLCVHALQHPYSNNLGYALCQQKATRLNSCGIKEHRGLKEPRGINSR